MPTTITIVASRYNALRNLVNKILGTPSDAGYGYGSTLLSSTVSSDTSKIDDQQYVNLYKDIVRIDAHQNGPGITIDPFVVGDYDTNLENTDLIEETYITALESKVNSLEASRFNIEATTQADIIELLDSSNSILNSSRSLIWNTSINHIFTVSFDDASAMNSFFNAGGQIIPSPRISYTGSQQKTLSWQNLCNDVGNIRMGIAATTDSLGKTSTKGFQDLTNSYIRVYTSNSGVAYSNNVIALDARISAANQVQIKLSFLDNHGENIDEYVQGITNNTVFLRVPNGEVTIDGSTLATVQYTSDIIGNTISAL